MMKKTQKLKDQFQDAKLKANIMGQIQKNMSKANKGKVQLNAGSRADRSGRTAASGY